MDGWIDLQSRTAVVYEFNEVEDFIWPDVSREQLLHRLRVLLRALPLATTPALAKVHP